jgi:endonuclease/exonuclease/phosphatase family metal-dependent hydrolase
MDPATLLLIVATYNIRFDNPADGPDAWPHRRDAMAQFIAGEQWDVFGMQEALHSQIQDLQQRLPQYAWVGVGRDDGRQGGEFSPIFYRADRFELLHSGTFWLSPTPEQPGSRGWNAAFPRVCTWAKLRDRKTQIAFGVLNTHFDHEGEEARLRSAELLRGTAEELLADCKHVILMGDLNAEIDEPPLRALLAPRTDAAAWSWDEASAIAKQSSGPSGTFNGFKEVPTEGRIDFILLRGWTVDRHQVLDPRVEGRFLSDHFPVVARMASATDR